MKKYMPLLFLCGATHMNAQEIILKVPDSIQFKNYDYLFDRIESENIDAAQRSLYLQSFLIKAKTERNWEEISNAYKNYVHYAPDRLKLVYADSMVGAAMNSKDNETIGAAYLSRGIAYYGQKRLREAMDNYLIADRYIAKTENNYQFYKVKYHIGLIKYYLGFYDKAIPLFEECIGFFKEEDIRAYLNSLHCLGLCYNMVGNHGLCTEINEEGIAEGHRLGNIDMESYFLHSEGVNQCMVNNFALSIEKIKIALPTIRKNGDFANESVGYFYIGKSYWGLGNKELAITYFKKVDQIYEQKGYLRPDLREGYELMITYYENLGLKDTEIYYIKKLLHADRNLSKTYAYLQGKIQGVYDTKKLELEKNKIEKSLLWRKYNDYIFLSIIAGLFLIVVFTITRYLKGKKKIRRKYEDLLQKLEDSKKMKSTPNEESGISMSKNAEDTVLAKLGKFEDSKKILEKDLNLTKLAGQFSTNPRYLSETISKHRQKSFNNYINGLKAEHIAKRINNEKTLRNYTDKALAEEAGFSSTRRFVNAFEVHHGISPRNFIEELKKDEILTTNI